jgi:hypothetical protein
VALQLAEGGAEVALGEGLEAAPGEVGDRAAGQGEGGEAEAADI